MSEYLEYLPFVLIAMMTLPQIGIRVSARRMHGRSVSLFEGLPAFVQPEKGAVVKIYPGCLTEPRLRQML